MKTPSRYFVWLVWERLLHRQMFSGHAHYFAFFDTEMKLFKVDLPIQLQNMLQIQCMYLKQFSLLTAKNLPKFVTFLCVWEIWRLSWYQEDSQIIREGWQKFTLYHLHKTNSNNLVYSFELVCMCNSIL